MKLYQNKKSIYWAGDRGFKACMRWHDEETIKILEEQYNWKVYYPFNDSIKIDESKYTGFFGKRGSLRNRCLMGIDISSIIVAYLGTYDTGTAQEIEYALIKEKPILGWSDSAVIVGEYAGRDIVVSQDEIEKLEIKILPMNGMTTVIDRYIEFSKLGNKVSPEKLAVIINKEAEIILGKL
ncbi:MAG: hypothetical protein HQK79_11200 [Desulfobacterales bacterium]|nr:hypothetical protein [Desulfobacterales bacterium]MBF0396900.1 hypothetical protein [Desulfobacterales bacterium]